MKNKLVKSIMYNFLAALTAFIFVPIFMIGNNPEDYSYLNINIFLKLGFYYTLILGLIFSLISFILHLLKLYRTSYFISSYIFIWILLAGLIFPVAISTGMVNPVNNPTDKINFLILIIIVPILSIINISSFNKYIKVFTSILLLTSIIPATISIKNSSIFMKSSNDGTSLSDKKNIIVISFDGMQGSITTDILRTNSEYSNKLKDFTVFTNAVSQSPSTTASIMGEVYGILDFKSKGTTNLTVDQALEDEGLREKLLFNQIADSYHYGYGKISENIIQLDNPMYQKYQATLLIKKIFLYPVVRIWTNRGVKLFKYKGILDKLTPSVDASILTKNLSKSYVPDWAKDTMLSMPLYDDFVSKLSVKDKDFSIRFLHFTFTHFPVKYDQNCKDRTDDKIWYDDNQNEEGIKNQEICAIGKFIDFIRKIKELGIYDNSLIVFKSDHGQPTNYFSTYPNNLRINNTKEWGYSRYRPTLMIKDFGTKNPNIIFKSNLVILNDLAKTLCEQSKVNIVCKDIIGVNLLGDSVENDVPYYLYVPKNSNGTWNYDTHMSVKIQSRKISLLEAMDKSGFIKLLAQEDIGPELGNNALQGATNVMSLKNGVLKLDASGSANTWVRKNFPTTIGETYTVKFKFSKGTASTTHRLVAIGNGNTEYDGTYFGATDPSLTNVFTFIAKGTSASLYMFAGISGYQSYENISIRKSIYKPYRTLVPNE